MPFSQNRQFPLLIEKLKLHLKAQGLRQRDIADRLGVGLATVKRWLAGEGLTTRRLEDLCDLAKVDLFDLVEMAARDHSAKRDRFTPSQERTLGGNPLLFFIFFSLLNGWPIEECERELRLSPEAMNTHLKALERLGLIDLFSDRRIRVLATRNVAWRKDGPIAKYFEARQSFVDVAGRPETALYMSDFVRLTEAGLLQLRHLVEELRREIHRIAQADRHAPVERTWQGILFLVRPLNMEAIRNSIATE